MMLEFLELFGDFLVSPEINNFGFGVMDTSENPESMNMMDFRVFPTWNRKAIRPMSSRIILRSFLAILYNNIYHKNSPTYCTNAFIILLVFIWFSYDFLMIFLFAIPTHQHDLGLGVLRCVLLFFYLGTC